MTWLSFDDGWTRQVVWDGVSYEARWHYHAMVEYCGSTRRYDGRMGAAAAMRCSDVPRPEECISELVLSGLVIRHSGDVLEVCDVDNYLPPIGQRDDVLLPRKRKNQAEYRKRKCESGRHDRHCPKDCPARGLPGGLPVTPGRDGTGSSGGYGGMTIHPATPASDNGHFGASPPAAKADVSDITRRVPSPKTGDGSENGVPRAQHIRSEPSAVASVADRYAREDSDRFDDGGLCAVCQKPGVYRDGMCHAHYQLAAKVLP